MNKLIKIWREEWRQDPTCFILVCLLIEKCCLKVEVSLSSRFESFDTFLGLLGVEFLQRFKCHSNDSVLLTNVNSSEVHCHIM